MPAIPGMNDTSISILVVLLALGFGFIGVMLYIIHRSRRRQNPMHLTDEQFLMDWNLPAVRPSKNWKWWIGGMCSGLALLILLGFTAERDDKARIADRIATRPSIVTLADCPPPGPGLTDTIVMVIKSQADLQPTVTRCSRIAERPQRKFRGRPVIAEAK